MFIQIAVDENIDLVKKIINEKSLTTLNLIDTRLKIEEEFQLEGFPTYLIIGKNGEILGHDIAGPLSPGLVDVIIYKALENQKSRDVVHYMVQISQQPVPAISLKVCQSYRSKPCQSYQSKVCHKGIVRFPL